MKKIFILLVVVLIAPTNHTTSAKQNSHSKEDEEKEIFVGRFEGTIGKKILVITIEKLSKDSLWGYNTVNRANKRPVRGKFSADCDVYSIKLKEPGDDTWDGVFELKMSNDNKFVMEGNWKSNNGKLKKPVSIKKK